MASCAELDRSQPRVEGSLEKCAKHVEDYKQVAELQGSSGVIGPGGHRREGGVRSGVDTCQGAIETQASSVYESRCCHRGSEVEGYQVGEGSGSTGEFFRGRGGLFAEGSRQGLRGRTGTSFGGSNQGMPRIHQPDRASCREVQFTHHGWPSWSNRSPLWYRSAMHSEPLPSQRRREVQ